MLSLLSKIEKEEILKLSKAGKSNRAIAKSIDRNESVVRRFLNSLKDVELDYAEDMGCKILLIDIETAPTRSYSWRRWKQNISQDMVIAESFVLTWAAKWLNDDSIYYDALEMEDVKEENDYEIVESMWNLLNQADIVIAHNGRRFDVPQLNSRFVFHGFEPPKTYKIVDTLEIAKRNFGFPSNSLDSLGSYLRIGRKIDTGGFSLWAECLNGVPEAWEKMIEYNLHDVELLEKVYLKLRAWDKNHPNVSLYKPSTDLSCACCNSNRLELTGGSVYTNVNRYEEYRCLDCGTLRRGRKSKFTKDKTEFLLMNVGN